MPDQETTFSVEVLGFPEGANPQALAEAVSDFFGISIDEGHRLVEKAPIRVKRKASAGVAKHLARQLLELGADVSVRNEQSGDERTYRAADAFSARDSAPISETLPSEDDAPPDDASPGEAPPEGDATLIEDTAPPLEDSPPLEARPPPEPEPVASPRGSQPRQPRPTPSHGSAISLPPPSSPILSLPPPSAAKLDFCASCGRPVGKGETCARCGWNKSEKIRSCRQCKRPLSMLSVITRKAAAVIAIGVVSLAAAVAAFVFFGFFAAAAVLAFSASCGFGTDALTLRYACRKCTVAVYTERLQKEETTRLRAGRGKALSIAVASALIMGGFLAITGFSGRALTDSSYGIAWRLPVPQTHSDLGSEVTSITVPTGSKRMRVQFARRPYISGTTYVLGHIQYTYPAGPADLDKPGLEAAVQQVISVVYGGTTTGPLESAGDAVQASFTGTFHGNKVFGRVRGTQHEHDMVFVVVTGSSESDVAGPSVDQVFGSVTVDRDAK